MRFQPFDQISVHGQVHDMMKDADRQSDPILGEKGYLQNDGKRQGFLSAHKQNAFSAPFFTSGDPDKKPTAEQQESMVDENHSDNQTNRNPAVYQHVASLRKCNPNDEKDQTLIDNIDFLSDAFIK
jgi:hypothetical protein